MPELLLLDINHRADLNILIVRWLTQPAVSALPQAYEQLAAAAQAANCRFWLQDIRRRTHNDPATSQWLLTDYFPLVARQLAGPLHVAYLLNPTLHQHILKEPGYDPAAAAASQSFAMGLFGEEKTAVEWLQAGQQNEAASNG